MPYFAVLLLLLTSVKITTSQESAQYLRNVIRDLKQMKDKSNSRKIVYSESTIADIPPTTTPSQPYINRRIQQNDIPELSLTKGELASIYQNAVSKGHTVQLDNGDNTFINAAIHELDDSNPNHSPSHIHDDDDIESHAEESGYYYYYYPIKSFLDEFASQPSDEDYHHSHNHKSHKYDVKPKHKYNYHTHTHQHNVRITKSTMETDKKNKLEPLFMAISGFLGMAVMFVLSVLVLPKFGVKPFKPKGKNDMGDLARIALQAIEGQDCRERFACELGKTARSLNLHENRFIKLFWRMAPSSLSKQFARFYKYNTNTKQMRCTLIPCKKKQTNVKIQASAKTQPATKSQTVAKARPKNEKKKTKKT